MMKRKIHYNTRLIGSLIALLAVMTFVSQAGAETRFNNDADKLWIESDLAVLELAELHVAGSGSIKFFALPETEELIYGEAVPVGEDERTFFSDEANTPLELFLALTPNHVPVPLMLIEFSELPEVGNPESGDDGGLSAEDQSEITDAAKDLALVEALAERAIVETLVTPVEVTPALPPVSPTAATGGSCGSQGAAYFKENHCGSMGPYGYGVSQTHCDNGSWLSLQRTSTKAMRHTYTRIAACGTLGQVIHSRNSISGFTTVFTGINAPNTVAHWYSYKKGWPWKRRARFERFINAGYVRGWTRFFKQVTD